MCRRRASNAGTALLCALLFITPAFAERADRDKPVNLQADHVTLDNRNQVSVFEGHVMLTQGTLTIRGDRMIVKQDAQGFRYGTVYGNLAHFRQKDDDDDQYVEGDAERIEYDGKAKLFQMFQRASLKKSDNDVHGDYISYEEDTQIFHVDGQDMTVDNTHAENAGSPATSRVRAVIQPNTLGKTPAAAATPASDQGVTPAAEVGVTLKPSTTLTAPRS